MVVYREDYMFAAKCMKFILEPAIGWISDWAPHFKEHESTFFTDSIRKKILYDMNLSFDYVKYEIWLAADRNTFQSSSYLTAVDFVTILFYNDMFSFENFIQFCVELGNIARYAYTNGILDSPSYAIACIVYALRKLRQEKKFSVLSWYEMDAWAREKVHTIETRKGSIIDRLILNSISTSSSKSPKSRVFQCEQEQINEQAKSTIETPKEHTGRDEVDIEHLEVIQSMNQDSHPEQRDFVMQSIFNKEAQKEHTAENDSVIKVELNEVVLPINQNNLTEPQLIEQSEMNEEVSENFTVGNDIVEIGISEIVIPMNQDNILDEQSFNDQSALSIETAIESIMENDNLIEVDFSEIVIPINQDEPPEISPGTSDLQETQ